MLDFAVISSLVYHNVQLIKGNTIPRLPYSEIWKIVQAKNFKRALTYINDSPYNVKIHYYDRKESTQTFYNFTSAANHNVNYSVVLDQNRRVMMTSGAPYLFISEPQKEWKKLHNTYDGTVVFVNCHEFPKSHGKSQVNIYTKAGMAIHKAQLFEEGNDGLKQEVFDCPENVYGLVKTHY
jgi:hypothetical protein